MEATHRHSSPQPPSNGDRMSLRRLAEQASRDVGSQLAAQAIREKWLASELRVWVQSIPGHPLARGASGYVFAPLGEEAAPPSFLEHLEQRVLTPPLFPNEPEMRGLKFATIIAKSETEMPAGDGKLACLFVSRTEAAKFWPWVDDPPQEGDQRKAMHGRRTPGAPKLPGMGSALIPARARISTRIA